MGPYVSASLHVGILQNNGTTPLGTSDALLGGLSRHFGAFLHGGDPPHQAPTLLPALQESTLCTAGQTRSVLSPL